MPGDCVSSSYSPIAGLAGRQREVGHLHMQDQAGPPCGEASLDSGGSRQRRSDWRAFALVRVGRLRATAFVAERSCRADASGRPLCGPSDQVVKGDGPRERSSANAADHPASLPRTRPRAVFQCGPGRAYLCARRQIAVSASALATWTLATAASSKRWPRVSLKATARSERRPRMSASQLGVVAVDRLVDGLAAQSGDARECADRHALLLPAEQPLVKLAS
jgi:hypothetical protein